MPRTAPTFALTYTSLVRIHLAGAPRSRAELEFAVSLQPCTGCLDRSELAWTFEHDDKQWISRAQCPRCQQMREYVVTSSIDLDAVRLPPRELGGLLPSTLFTSRELTDEVERQLDVLATDPTLTEPQRSQNWQRIVRIETGLNEIAKFIAQGGDAFFGGGTAMMRAYVAAERERIAALVSKLASVWAQGVLVACDLRLVRAPDASLERASVSSCAFDRASLVRSLWDHAVVSGSSFVETDLSNAMLRRTRLFDCNLAGSTLRGAELTGAMFERCDLRGVDLSGATLIGATLRHCTLSDMTGYRAAIVACDVRMPP